MASPARRAGYRWSLRSLRCRAAAHHPCRSLKSGVLCHTLRPSRLSSNTRPEPPQFSLLLFTFGSRASLTRGPCHPLRPGRPRGRVRKCATDPARTPEHPRPGTASRGLRRDPRRVRPRHIPAGCMPGSGAITPNDDLLKTPALLTPPVADAAQSTPSPATDLGRP